MLAGNSCPGYFTPFYQQGLYPWHSTFCRMLCCNLGTPCPWSTRLIMTKGGEIWVNTFLTENHPHFLGTHIIFTQSVLGSFEVLMWRWTVCSFPRLFLKGTLLISKQQFQDHTLPWPLKLKRWDVQTRVQRRHEYLRVRVCCGLHVKEESGGTDWKTHN